MLAASLLLLVSLAYTGLMGYALSRPRTTAMWYFILMLLCSTAWAVSYFFELTLPSFDQKLIAKLARFPFLCWLPLLWIRMLGQLFNLGLWIPRAVWIALFVVNCVLIGVAVTSPFHSLFLNHTGIFVYGSVGILTFESGILYRLNTAYMNLFSLFGAGLMLVEWIRSSGVRRRNLAMLLLGFAVPLAMNIVYALGSSPVAHINLAPFTMAISITAFAYVVLHNRILDVVPLARGMLFDQLPDLVLVTNASHVVVDINAASRQWIELAGGELVGKTQSMLPEPWKNAMQGNSRLFSANVGGQESWFDASCLAIKDEGGASIGSLHVFRDVTLRHKAEMALRESEEQLRGIVNSISEAVFIHTLDGEIVFVNKPMLQMYGLKTEAEARQFSILNEYSSPDADVALGRNAMQRAAAGEKVFLKSWTSRRPLTGELFDVQVVLQGIYHGGRPLVLATVTDITEHLQRQAEQVVLERSHADARLIWQQKRLLRDMHDGVGGIAANIGLLASLGARATEISAKDATFGTIETLAAECNSEIRSLMNVLERRDFCWSDWLLEVRQYVQAFCTGRQLCVTSQVDGGPPEAGLALTSGVSLFRVIKEAVNNVVKHADARCLDLRIAFSPDALDIRIADDGHGFNPETVKAGRGMSNMRRRVVEMGGQMDVTAAHGTTLAFRIPLSMNAADSTGEEVS